MFFRENRGTRDVMNVTPPLAIFAAWRETAPKRGYVNGTAWE
jgi:hypothetical protein